MTIQSDSTEKKLYVKPNGSVGVTFKWSGGRLVVESFQKDNEKALKKSGIAIGDLLHGLNGTSFAGWTLDQIVDAMKRSAQDARVLTFSPPSAQDVPPLPSDRLVGHGRSLPAPRPQPLAPKQRATPTRAVRTGRGPVLPTGGGQSHAERSRQRRPSHADPFSTPSRRRRVYLQMAQVTYLTVKKDAVSNVLLYRLHTRKSIVIQCRIRAMLSKKRVARLRARKRDRAATVMQCLARKRAARIQVDRFRDRRQRRRRRLAARTIQSAWRRRLAHAECARRRKERARALAARRANAVSVLQSFTRGTFSRVALRVLVEKRAKDRAAATTIQSAWRRVLARRKRRRLSRLRKENAEHERRMHLMSASARAIQAMWRLSRARREQAARRKQRRASMLISGFIRRSYVQKGVMAHAERLKLERALVEHVVEELQPAEPAEHEASASDGEIEEDLAVGQDADVASDDEDQCGEVEHVSEEALSDTNDTEYTQPCEMDSDAAASCIQAVVRRLIVKKRLKARADAAKREIETACGTIQKTWRHHKRQQQADLARTRASVRIQSAWRRVRAVHRFQGLWHEHVHACSTKINEFLDKIVRFGLGGEVGEEEEEEVGEGRGSVQSKPMFPLEAFLAREDIPILPWVKRITTVNPPPPGCEFRTDVDYTQENPPFTVLAVNGKVLSPTGGNS